MSDLFKNCLECGAQFKKKWEGLTQKFCSKDCSTKYRAKYKKRESYTCHVCTNNFVGKTADRERKLTLGVKERGYVFCGKLCALKFTHKNRKAKRTETTTQKECPACRTLFSHKICRPQIYCSRDCADKVKVIPPTKPQNCFVCTQEFLPTPKQKLKEQRGTRLCCSRRCAREVRAKIKQNELVESEILYWQVPND